jgi:hypothetical protein
MTTCKVSLWSSLSNLIGIYSAIDGYIYMSNTELAFSSWPLCAFQEMKLLAEVDQPGSRIDRYVSQLNYVLSRKAAGIVNLQARLARFQRHLKEQEILSRTGGLRQV